jgi:hypothetical protein
VCPINASTRSSAANLLSCEPNALGPGSVTVTQVARNFAEYVNRVAYRRESFTLVRGKKRLAELRDVWQS